MTKEFQDKILDTLQEKKVTPKSRWTFLVKEKIIWLSAGVIILLGSLAAATTMAIVSMYDLDIAERLEHTKTGWLILSLPYAWILLLIGFILLAEYNIRHTKQGYRYSLAKMTGAVIGLSILGGIGLYTIGLGHNVDDVMSQHVPAYEKFGNRRAMHLLNPELGFLAGKVILQKDTTWHVQDIERHIWIVDVEQAKIIGKEYILVERPVRIIGELQNIDTWEFTAEEIMPLRPPKGFNRGEARKKFNAPLPSRQIPPQ